jgi:hypothetical protein
MITLTAIVLAICLGWAIIRAWNGLAAESLQPVNASKAEAAAEQA